jgi:hypothetical protein
MFQQVPQTLDRIISDAIEYNEARFLSEIMIGERSGEL